MLLHSIAQILTRFKEDVVDPEWVSNAMKLLLDLGPSKLPSLIYVAPIDQEQQD